jgi:ABC-type Fe3+-siderophore transport system permease subunit
MEYLIPRFTCAFLCGMILSQSGSLIQMSSRNILASPSTLGFDGLSILWILLFHSVMVYFRMDQPLLVLIAFGIPLFICLGQFFSKFMRSQTNINRLILIGLTFNLLVGAVFSLWQFFFLAFNLPFPVELWFGHFRFANIASSTILFFTEILFILGWFYFRKKIFAFTLGTSISTNICDNYTSLHSFMFIFVALGTFGVIGLFGAFSFLGLIFPIIARRFWFKRADIKGELFAGALMNGLILCGIDAFCYFLPIYGADVPVGLIATTLGAVSLILLLWR